MKKPLPVDDWGIYYPYKQRYLAEYILWESARTMAAPEGQERMMTDYRKSLQASNVCGLLAYLCDHGKAVRLSRGVYMHYNIYRMFS